jgi:hypothetical protein
MLAALAYRKPLGNLFLAGLRHSCRDVTGSRGSEIARLF